jgi:hypothetical protein
VILDGFLLLTGNSQGATGTIASGSYTDTPTTGTQDGSNIIDLGEKGGIPASAQGGGARDIGIGNPDIWLFCTVTTAFTGGTSLAVELQYAPDNGSGAPGSWTVVWASPVAEVEANLVVGAQLCNINVPRQIPDIGPPRFVKATFVSVGTHTGGAVEMGIALDRFDQIMGTGANAGVISGYPAGINIAN